MLEPLDYILDRWSKAHVSHEYILQKIDQVNVVIDHLQLVLGQQHLSLRCQLHVELDVVFSIEKHFARE